MASVRGGGRAGVAGFFCQNFQVMAPPSIRGKSETEVETGAGKSCNFTRIQPSLRQTSHLHRITITAAVREKRIVFMVPLTVFGLFNELHSRVQTELKNVNFCTQIISV